jgi:hypothetical protein
VQPVVSHVDHERLVLPDLTQLPGIDFDMATPDSFDQPVLLADFQLPPHHILLELVGLFFKNHYSMFPCLHRKLFQSELENGLLQRESPMLLYAICCVSAPYHPDVCVREHSKHWYEQAKFSYDLTQRNPRSGLRTIQTALLLILHAYTLGDFSASWLFLGKVWRQVVALGMNRMDAGHALGPRALSRDLNGDIEIERNQDENNAVQREEYRRTLWLMLIMDWNHAWPTAWPNTVLESHFKVDIPIAETMFQAMDPMIQKHRHTNVPFTRNLNRLVSSVSSTGDQPNVFHYVIIAHILLGKVAKLVQSLHDTPDISDNAEDCEELDILIVKFRLSLPRQATSVLDARPADRAHVVWLQVTLNTSAILLHFRCSTGIPGADSSSQYMLAVTAARNIAQIIRDVSRVSVEPLLSPHIGSALYVASAVLIIQWRLTGDPSLKDAVDLFHLVFERMNDVYVFLGMKFKIALEHDLKRSQESLNDLQNRGVHSLLADCTRWTHIKEEVERRGLMIDIT